MTLENIRQRNNLLIQKYMNDKDNLYRQNLIKKLLSDDDCFFKITIEETYNILTDLEYSEKELEKIYMDLVSYNNF